MIVILGAGLAGMSTAFHLGKDYTVYEREQTVGGLCRTRQAGRFQFDYTGHLLHLRNDHTRRLVAELLPDAFRAWSRSAWIYSKGVYTPYPFQANTHGLPPEVIKECLLGYFEAREASISSPDSGAGPDESFEHWVLRIFGKGYAKHFMIPYNEKLWQAPAAEMTADWVSWSVPRPEPEEVLNGALGINNRAFGYNPTFMYPVQGGIEVLPRALATRIHPPKTGKQASRIEPSTKTVHFSDGGAERYDFLVSTLPLKELFRIVDGVPDQLADAVAQLRCTSVVDINLGVNREGIGDSRHWIYVPEPEFPFYRVGFPSNFSRTVAPAGTSSMYVEVAHRQGAPVDQEQILDKAIRGLIACEIIQKDDVISAVDIADIPYAYVIYDRHRQKVLPEAMSYLEALGIYSTGRYGAWVYGSMEDAILQGKDVAEKIRQRMG